MKLIKILLISICILITLSHNIYALDELFSIGSKWMDDGHDRAGIGLDTSVLIPNANNLYYTLLALAMGVAIIVGAILGIKYMTAGIEEKAQVKESLIPYMISCVVVFGSLGIWKLVVTIIKDFI